LNLKEAEELLQYLKRQTQITEYWCVETDEGIKLEVYPLGYAADFEWRDLLTVLPRKYQYALFEGTYEPHRVPHWHPFHMWEQELYVFYRELREQMAAALRDLHHAPYARRKGELQASKSCGDSGAAVSGLAPQPEDFTAELGTIRPLLMSKPKGHGTYWRMSRGRRYLTLPEVQELKQDFCRLLERFIEGDG
jgi:hypothetical protein